MERSSNSTLAGGFVNLFTIRLRGDRKMVRSTRNVANQPCPSTTAYILSSAPVHLCLSVDNSTIEFPQVDLKCSEPERETVSRASGVKIELSFMPYLGLTVSWHCAATINNLNGPCQALRPAPRCPANSQYELCGSACPATCSDPDATLKCKRPCIETCSCKKGFLWSGNRCVPAKKCGCTYNGRYVPAGESFWADQNCQKWCRCDPKSQKVDCKDKGCRNGEQCQVVDGIRKCAAISVKTCQATGDPHYKTFDGKKFDFQGTCVYQLTALCSEDPELVPFEVYVQNNNRGNKAVSLTKLVEVKVFSISIVITQTHKGHILVNNELVNLPISLQDGDVNVYKSGMYAVVHTNFGLKVIFNWQSAVFVTLPSVYMGAVCGLCGNYNDKPADDLIPKNGNNPANPADFGASWRVAEIPGCVDQCKGNCPDCDKTEMVQYEKEDFCGIIRDPTGPFRDCHAKVDPAGYFEDCVYDVCLFRGRKDVLCQSITSYTSACQAVGAKVYSWRTGQFCGQLKSNKGKPNQMDSVEFVTLFERIHLSGQVCRTIE
ncbi:IgGFc-binding protein-like [Eucyclogobius newberryi]|uniref:IgGFc-binding protein-like n=1 Tax=Eucyclogobius newberryi TaxID=166745 RepID=UPI003B59AC0D